MSVCACACACVYVQLVSCFFHTIFAWHLSDNIEASPAYIDAFDAETERTMLSRSVHMHENITKFNGTECRLIDTPHKYKLGSINTQRRFID